MIEVVRPGSLTTVQDGGRPGLLGQGIPPAGAQDHYALKAASVLVGNRPPPPPLSLGDPGDAGLEATLFGPVLRFHAPTVIAVTGGQAAVTLDGSPIPMWTSVRVEPDAVLDMGTVVAGARTYLAVAGGIDVPLDLGSRSTYVVAARGGFQGRRLAAGDRLPLGEPRGDLDALAGRALPPELVPRLEPPLVLRAVAGPQEHLFEPAAVEAFYSSPFTLTPQSSRMGARFTGPELPLKPKADYLMRDAGSGVADIVDDVTPLGGVQVPGGVQLIVMGVEVPSGGGFAKIATVISADISRLAQLRPGDTATFARVSAEEAIAIGREQSRVLDTAVGEIAR